MGKIDVTTGVNSSYIKQGHAGSLLNSEEARKARLEAVLKNKQEPANDPSFSPDPNLSKQEERMTIGGEVKDPKIQNERIKKLLAEINDLRLENESLLEEKDSLSKNLLEISRALDKAGVKIKDGEIVETKKTESTSISNALRPSYPIKNRKVDNVPQTTTEITKQDSIRQPTTLRTSNIVRLPTKKSNNETEQKPETQAPTEKPVVEIDDTPIHDFLHPNKFSEAVNAVHNTDDEDVVARIDEVIEAEPFLPPEEPVVEEKPIAETKEEEPESITLDQSGNIEVLSKRSNLEKLAAVSDLVNSVFKDAANDPVMLAHSATGKLAA